MIATFRDQQNLALENLALRQQLGVLKRKVVPRLKRSDRAFWVILSRIWPDWRKPLHLIKADTVVGWTTTRLQNVLGWTFTPQKCGSTSGEL
jgi:hypothetical protein